MVAATGARRAPPSSFSTLWMFLPPFFRPPRSVASQEPPKEPKMLLFSLALLLPSTALAQSARGSYGCPEQYGVQTYPHDQYCDQFYKVNY